MKLKKAGIEDFEFFYDIKCEDDNLFWCGYVTKPDKKRLWAFWKQNIAENSLRDIYIAVVNNQSVGYAYVDYHSESEIELSLGVSSRVSGKGYGTGLILSLLEKYKDKYKYITAFVREDNIRSQRVFDKAGFVCLKKTRMVNDENENVLVLNKWLYKGDQKE
jgi:RimJ/RimL family protein N-acetyltransferase